MTDPRRIISPPRRVLGGSGGGGGGGGGGGASSVTWETTSDWDGASSESGVVHQSVSGTDHTDSTIVKQGYDIDSPFNSGSLDVYLPLHEDSGTTANNFGSDTDDGSVSGPTQGQTGILGTTSYSFDGQDDRVSVVTVDFEESGFAMSCWVNAPNLRSEDGRRFMEIYDSSGRLIGFGNDPVGNADASSIGLDVTNNSGNDRIIVNNNIPVNDGNWHHVAASVPGTDMSNWQLYFDGSPVTTTVEFNQHSNTYSETGTLYLAHNPSGRFTSGNNYTEATIADPRYYTSSLTDSEVKTIYDVAGTDGSLVTGWKTMDADAVTLETDSTIPSNTSIDVTVEQDEGSTGSVDNSQTVSLSGGTTETNSLTGFADTSGQYRLDISLGNVDVTATADLDRAEVKP